MKALLRVSPQGLEHAADQAALAKQKARSADPGAPLPQGAVVVQVINSLTQQICKKYQADAPEPGQAPLVRAAQGQVEVKGGALVLRLLGAVPQPHGLETLFAALKQLRVAEQPVGKHGGEVFGRRGDGQPMPRVKVSHDFQALTGPCFPVVEQPMLLDLAVEQRMNSPMGCLLAYEALRLCGEFFLQSRRQGFEPAANRVHEKLLAKGEAHGQGIEYGGTKGIPAKPMAWHRGI